MTYYAGDGEKYIESSDEFKFSGISVTKTKVGGSYETKRGRVPHEFLDISATWCIIISRFPR